MNLTLYIVEKIYKCVSLIWIVNQDDINVIGMLVTYLIRICNEFK